MSVLVLLLFFCLFVCLFFPSDPKETFYFSIADEGRVDSSLVHKPEPVMVRGAR